MDGRYSRDASRHSHGGPRQPAPEVIEPDFEWSSLLFDRCGEQSDSTYFRRKSGGNDEAN